MDNHARELESAVAALHDAAARLVQAQQYVRAQATREMVDLAIALARRITKRQAAVDPQVLVANLKDALALAGRDKQVRIAIHPSQKAVLSTAMPHLKLEWPAMETAQILEDGSLSPGGCRVYTDHGSIDADIESQLTRVIDNLIPPQPPEVA